MSPRRRRRRWRSLIWPSASSTELLLTPTHLLTLCNCTNHWQRLMTAGRLGTLLDVWARWVGLKRDWANRGLEVEMLTSIDRNKSGNFSHIHKLNSQSRVSRNDIADITKNMSSKWEYASSHATNHVPTLDDRLGIASHNKLQQLPLKSFVGGLYRQCCLLRRYNHCNKTPHRPLTEAF